MNDKYWTYNSFCTEPSPKILAEYSLQLRNEGYINSNIPIRVTLHCVIESEIADGQPADVTLSKFKDSQAL